MQNRFSVWSRFCKSKKENGKFTREMLSVYGSYADGYDK